jgi:hypothetical protein
MAEIRNAIVYRLLDGNSVEILTPPSDVTRYNFRMLVKNI